MSWDPVWESVFQRRSWGRYPPEELIRFVARQYADVPDRSAIRLLEIGCGPGANIWYLAREGFSAVGIDGSDTALRQARERLAADALHARLIRGDIVDLPALVEPRSFDAVVDVCAIQHNRLDAVRRCLSGVGASLRPGGAFFSMLVAAESWGDGDGVELEPGTYNEIADGPLRDAGLTHFFELAEVERLFEGFSNLEIEYSERSLDDRRKTYRHWVVTCSRPG